MNNLNKSLDEISSSHRFHNFRIHRRGLDYIRRIGNGKFKVVRKWKRKGEKTRRMNRLNKLNLTSQRDNRRRLFITNLNKKLNNNDLKNIFQKYGKLRRCGINFTQLGESKGNADVEFDKHNDAVNAIRNLNNSNIHGRVIIVKFSHLKNINRVGKRLRFRNRNLNNLKRRNHRNGIRKRKIFKKSLGRRRRQ